jgi:hypothetical protein
MRYNGMELIDHLIAEVEVKRIAVKSEGQPERQRIVQVTSRQPDPSTPFLDAAIR